MVSGVSVLTALLHCACASFLLPLGEGDNCLNNSQNSEKHTLYFCSFTFFLFMSVVFAGVAVLNAGVAVLNAGVESSFGVSTPLFLPE